MCMVKCNTPDCMHLEMYPTGRNLDEVKSEWDKRVNCIMGVTDNLTLDSEQNPSEVKKASVLSLSLDDLF